MEEQNKIEKNDFSSLAPMLFLGIPLLVKTESRLVDDLLKRILEIRQQPKEQHAELASDLVADITKKATRDLMQNVPCGLGALRDVRK